MAPPERGKSGADDLWIECPHCEGGGGWYGCENCAAVLSTDRGEPPAVRLCAECSPMRACIQSGGHEWGRLHCVDGQWLLDCIRDCGAAAKVTAHWQQHGDSYAHVAVYYGTTYAAASAR